MKKQITDTQALGDFIRQTRKAQGLTQLQLAAFSNVGLRFLRELEQGKVSCHLGKTLHVLHMLGIKLFASEDNSP